MNHEADSIHQSLGTPRAAAIAGIVFSLLLMTSMFLIRTSIPADPLAAEADVMKHVGRISLALNLLPFAGISFLWFVGVLRDRLGQLEDRFFATVFFGSALLFLAMVFTAASVVGGILRLLASGSENGRRVHDLDFYNLVENRDHSALDGLPGFRAGLNAPAERRNLPGDFTGLPALGALNQHIYLD